MAPHAIALGSETSSYAGQSQVVYRTGFERPRFTVGQPVVGRGGFFARLATRDDAGIITTTDRTGRQALRVRGDRLGADDGIVQAVFSPDLFLDPIARRFSIVDVKVAAKLSGPSTDDPNVDGGDDDLVSANLGLVTEVVDGERLSASQLILSSNGHAYVIDAQGDYLFETRAQLGRYHTLRARLNYETQTEQFFIDGRRVGSLDASLTGFFAADIALVALDDLSVVDPSHYSAQFDDYIVQVGNTREPRQK